MTTRITKFSDVWSVHVFFLMTWAHFLVKPINMKILGWASESPKFGVLLTLLGMLLENPSKSVCCLTTHHCFSHKTNDFFAANLHFQIYLFFCQKENQTSSEKKILLTDIPCELIFNYSKYFNMAFPDSI